PRRRLPVRDWACRFLARSSRIIMDTLTWKARWARAPHSRLFCPYPRPRRRNRMDKENYRPTIMVLDDEEMVTTSLTNLFGLRTDYRTIACTSTTQALTEAGNHTFDLVIADYLMPGMDGIAFLSRFKEVQPMALRILLTGYADKERAIRAITQVG